MNITVITFDTLDSTNTEAVRQAKLGADEGLCIVARQQTAGRGRHGRTWISEKDAGLYFSVILRPKLETGFLPLITLMAGVAVHDTLVEFGLEPDIKWVNDVFVNEKKISGILAEATETPGGQAVIVGIGINLRSSNVAAELSETATSIEDAIAEALNTGDITSALTRNLDRYYSVLNGKDGKSAILDAWRKRSTYFVGKRVRVSTGTEVIIGVTDGLEENGALRVLRDDGTAAVIQTGDVERLRADAD